MKSISLQTYDLDHLSLSSIKTKYGSNFIDDYEITHNLHDSRFLKFTFSPKDYQETSAVTSAVIDLWEFQAGLPLSIRKVVPYALMSFLDIELDGGVLKTTRHLLSIAKRVLHFMRRVSIKNNVSTLSELTEDQILNSLASFAAGSDMFDPHSANVTEQLLYRINEWSNKFQIGLLPDGPSVQLNVDQHIRSRTSAVAQAITEKLGDSDFDSFSDWLKGLTHGLIPVEVATLLVSWCIQVLHSPVAKELEILVPLIRGLKNHEVKQLGGPDECIDNLIEAISADPMKWGFADRYKEVFNKKPSFLTLQKSIHGKFSTELNFQLERCRGAFTTIFMVLSMCRQGEAAGITFSGMERVDEGAYRFMSPIQKTNHGIHAERYITSQIEPLFEKYLRMTISSEGNRRLLLSQTFSKLGSNYQSNTVETLDNGLGFIAWKTCHDSIKARVKKTYKRFLSEVNSEVAEKYPNIRAHSLRHVMPSFCVRRFDGEVYSVLQTLLRHDVGSYFTPHYYSSRLMATESKFIQLDYLREIFGLHFSGDQTLYGGIARELERMAANITVLNFEEIHSLVDEISEQVYELSPHQYGYCLVLKKNKTKSACYDRQAGKPRTETAGISMCSACPNFAFRENNAASLKQVQLTLALTTKEHPFPASLIGLDATYQRVTRMLAELGQ